MSMGEMQRLLAEAEERARVAEEAKVALTVRLAAAMDSGGVDGGSVGAGRGAVDVAEWERRVGEVRKERRVER